MVEEWDTTTGALYRGLGLIATALAESDGRLDGKRVAELRQVLS
jgi:hypothetical protein